MAYVDEDIGLSTSKAFVYAYIYMHFTIRSQSARYVHIYMRRAFPREFASLKRFRDSLTLDCKVAKLARLRGRACEVEMICVISTDGPS